jgi:hypothetical protein
MSAIADSLGDGTRISYQQAVVLQRKLERLIDRSGRCKDQQAKLDELLFDVETVLYNLHASRCTENQDD